MRGHWYRQAQPIDRLSRRKWVARSVRQVRKHRPTERYGESLGGALHDEPT